MIIPTAIRARAALVIFSSPEVACFARDLSWCLVIFRPFQMVSIYSLLGSVHSGAVFSPIIRGGSICAGCRDHSSGWHESLRPDTFS